jgi:hypothetical protein
MFGDFLFSNTYNNAASVRQLNLCTVHEMYLEGSSSQGPPHILTHRKSVVIKSVYLHLDGLLGNVY